uniref:BTB domain-containing protein n=1 Tax=Sarcophilus harrisii TaxID=9305 RepID=G3WEF0_SARHA
MDHCGPGGELLAAIGERCLGPDEEAHVKASLGSGGGGGGGGEMGVSAHLQSSKAGTTRFFRSNTHSSVVLRGFDQLRGEGLLCDVSLVPGDGDEAFPVHRAMMASASDYFKAMFTGGMKEQDLKCIKLHGVNKVGLKKIIDFIYTAKLSLTMDNLQDTLEAASFLQVLPALDFCKVFLISGVSLENCVEVGRLANTYNLTEVDKYVNNFILRNFPALLHSGEFEKLPFERLAAALASNSLKHCGELELFKAACRWLRHEEPRMELAPKLMKNIRFPLMSPQDLINHVQTVDFMRADNTCVNLLLEASNYQMMPYMQPVMQSERTAIRSDSTHLVTLGGVLRQQLVVSKELRMYDEKANEWKALAPMDAPRYQHGIAVIGNFLYVVGGQSNYDTKGKTAVDTVFRFDPRSNKWILVAPLNEKRTFFHLSALKGHLYAVGGRNAAGELATVECYSPRMNEWSYVAKMSEPHYGHAGTLVHPGAVALHRGQLSGRVAAPHGVQVALERAQVEEGALLVEGRHQDPLVGARVEAEDRVHRGLALGVVVALAAHHVEEVADDGDPVLVARRVHGRQGLPLVAFCRHRAALADHQLLPQHAAQGDQVRDCPSGWPCAPTA